MSVVAAARVRLNRRFARSAPEWLKRGLRHRVPVVMELERLELIERAGLDELRDAGWLEETLLPALGINDDAPELFPPELRRHLGQGLRYWQYPCQLAPYLVLLSRLGIRSYIEIGVQHGGTFVLTTEYLNRFNPVASAIAIDLVKVRSLREYAARRPGAEFRQDDSQSRAFRRFLSARAPVDLVLIDGDHSRDAVRRDWETVRPHARVVAFHDIVDHQSPGVGQTWREVRAAHAAEYEFHEFTRQYPEVRERTGATHLGIGVAIRR